MLQKRSIFHKISDGTKKQDFILPVSTDIVPAAVDSKKKWCFPVWCGIKLGCTDPWLQGHATPLGWSETQARSYGSKSLQPGSKFWKVWNPKSRGSYGRRWMHIIRNLVGWLGICGCLVILVLYLLLLRTNLGLLKWKKVSMPQTWVWGTHYGHQCDYDKMNCELRLLFVFTFSFERMKECWHFWAHQVWILYLYCIVFDFPWLSCKKHPKSWCKGLVMNHDTFTEMQSRKEFVVDE